MVPVFPPIPQLFLHLCVSTLLASRAPVWVGFTAVLSTWLKLKPSGKSKPQLRNRFQQTSPWACLLSIFFIHGCFLECSRAPPTAGGAILSRLSWGITKQTEQTLGSKSVGSTTSPRLASASASAFGAPALGSCPDCPSGRAGSWKITPPQRLLVMVSVS